MIKKNLKEFGVLKDTIKGTSSPKNVQTIPFEGIHLKEFEGIRSFFLCMLRVLGKNDTAPVQALKGGGEGGGGGSARGRVEQAGTHDFSADSKRR
jgi:hypothetical protein